MPIIQHFLFRFQLMRLLWLPTLILLVTNAYGQDVTKKNVLFIGNSLTYYSGMPDYLKAMLQTTNQRLNIGVSAYPGMSLESHLNSIIEARTEDGINTRKKKAGEQTETEKVLLSKKWDIVILQEAPVRILIPEIRKYSTEVSIKKIKQLVNNQQCKFILFKTWAPKREFPTRFCYPASMLNRSSERESYCSIQVNSLEEEYNLLNVNYDSVAVETQLGVVDIGRIYYEVSKKQPSIILSDKESHPTKFGAYLNAYIFYKFLVNQKPISFNYYGDLSKEDAILLQKLSD